MLGIMALKRRSEAVILCLALVRLLFVSSELYAHNNVDGIAAPAGQSISHTPQRAGLASTGVETELGETLTTHATISGMALTDDGEHTLLNFNRAVGAVIIMALAVVVIRLFRRKR